MRLGEQNEREKGRKKREGCVRYFGRIVESCHPHQLLQRISSSSFHQLTFSSVSPIPPHLVIDRDGLFPTEWPGAGAYDEADREEAGEIGSASPLPTLPVPITATAVTAVQKLPQRAGNYRVDGPQMQDFMRLYSSLVERCFNACTQDFTSKALSKNEVSI